jgi:hypothetical protein
MFKLQRLTNDICRQYAVMLPYCKERNNCLCVGGYIQSDQNFSVHVRSSKNNTIITTQSSLPHYMSQYGRMAGDRQDQGDTRLRLTPSVILNCNYIIILRD